MVVGTATFPASLDTAATLVLASNLTPPTVTTDSGGVGANSVGGTTIAVASTAGYSTSGIFTIDSEIISYLAIAGNTFTGCVRGLEGTTAAVHVLGASVNQYETALHHNVLRDAIIATEQKVGVGGSVAATNTVLWGSAANVSIWSPNPTLSTLTTTLTPSSIAQEAWTAMILVNSWVNVGGGNQTAAYMKDAMGFIHLRGLISTGTINTACYTLPAPCRPALAMNFATMSAGAFGYLTVSAAGVITPTVGSSTNFSLDGITFDGR